MALPGVIDVLTAADVPGKNALMTGGPLGEEMLFVPVHGVVEAVGVGLAAVLATTRAIANHAAGLVTVVYRNTEHTPIFSLRDAIAAESFFPTDVSSGGPMCNKLSRGDATSAMASSLHTLSGEVALGGQRHFYMEPQTTMAKLGDGLNGSSIDVTTATQDPCAMQQVRRITSYATGKTYNLICNRRSRSCSACQTRTYK
jgi:xanthine dehydrogenase molybdopterin-binding subunit B